MQKNSNLFTTEDVSIIFDLDEPTVKSVMLKYEHSFVKGEKTLAMAVNAFTLDKMRVEFERKYKAYINLLFLDELAAQINYTESWIQHYLLLNDVRRYCILNPNRSQLKAKPVVAITREDAEKMLKDFGAEGLKIQEDFLKDSYWPDVVPNCFKNMPDDSELDLIPLDELDSEVEENVPDNTRKIHATSNYD